ncbi:unnamed protein product, partial [Staurois parvus]
MSVPKAVSPSYTRAYHAALHRESLQSLPCPFAPAMCPLQRPRPSPPKRRCQHPASVLRSPVTSGRTGAPPPTGNLKILKNVLSFKTNFSYALSCAACILSVLS